VLEELALYVTKRLSSGQAADLTFICTHNSRRSHLAQIWCQVAAHYFAAPNVRAFSGGTAATACNVRTIRALRRAGLSAVASTEGDNPLYLVQFADDAPPIKAYSKVYRAEENPQTGFAATMFLPSRLTRRFTAPRRIHKPVSLR
jgi:arsenate reductase